MSNTALVEPFSYSLDIFHHLGYMMVIAQGQGSKSEITNMYQTIEKTAKIAKVNKLMLNVTELTLNYSGSDVVKVLKLISRLFNHFYIARIVTPADFKSDLIEVFAQKHALNIKSFFCENEAYDWLIEQY
ncbi:hypothetical protein HG263_12835 [Pseudoalteromonas sp. JBTF-M23]|uniref:SpoIIAA-like protein n=1 Tax=Pseudoalteromonas caenipelagi TaxID=2726988 RepID=A0A849VE59_9GAMM|nr:hypothetical protein [Pseudoalteromonas caenipelagi]NOU51415.1 hypothetical protein [Pseudoalteromonas caenipelagi]